MAYLTTLLTYNVPAEAEVDKAYLESNGIDVCLLNANTSRNELGAPFYVRLQVNDEDAEEARDLIMRVNPQRFGSNARVAEIDRQIRRALVRFVCIALPLGIAVGLATYLLTPNPVHAPMRMIRRYPVVWDVRVELGIAAAILASVAAAAWDSRRRARVKNSESEAGPPPCAG